MYSVGDIVKINTNVLYGLQGSTNRHEKYSVIFVEPSSKYSPEFYELHLKNIDCGLQFCPKCEVFVLTVCLYTLSDGVMDTVPGMPIIGKMDPYLSRCKVQESYDCEVGVK